MSKSSEAPDRRPTVVELFSGAGGLTLGCHLAGFRTATAFDKDKDLTSSFNTNFPEVPLHHVDLSTVSPSSLVDLVGTHVDGVVGGPPCQGFSEMGRRDASDPRNDLLVRFAEAVNALKPRFFVMENVPGLAAERYEYIFRSMLETFDASYTIYGPHILDAADFGAATRRRRMTLIGFDLKRMKPLDKEALAATTGTPTTVREAIADLPAALGSSGTALTYCKDTAALTDYALRMRQSPPDGLGSKESRIANGLNRVTSSDPTKHTPNVVERFKLVEQGKRDPISRYPRLSWGQPAPVLRAGTGRDKGSFQAARPIHPEAPRVITVREAARLQGFPDWFEFSPTKWHSHRMIGNSVSPIFAEAIMGIVRQHLKED